MKELFNLSNKIALITGSTSGMGKAIAEALGENGAKIIISSPDTEGGNETLKAFKNKGIEAVFISCDVSKKSEIKQLYEKSIAFYGKIDILVSCVGIAMPNPFLEISAADFEKTMALNLQSAIYLTKLVIPQMRERKDGAIIYLASIAGVRGNKSIGLYGISKAGLIQLARNLAVEFGPDNIRVNCISPGMIDTPFSKGLMSDESFMKKRLALTPLRRVGTVEEIAGVAVVLASKAGGFITGQNIVVDGGTTIGDGN
ncbi:MAG: SDR family oxidoreductase [Saprospiraceae bacterium]|nr:SDR family oxidoreductase [Saprospiraceae bacterium]